jgi:hypothetical protein
MPVIGNNDFSVGFLTLLALVLLLRKPKLGLAFLAAAVAIKPYAAAWALPAALFAGWGATLIALIVSAVLWGPVILVWGIPSFLQSMVAAERLRTSLTQVPSWSFADLPVLRLLIAPITAAAFWFRSWRSVILIGSIAFLVFLGFAPRAPQPYIGYLLPILGMGVESRLSNETARRGTHARDSPLVEGAAPSLVGTLDK